ncbi:MAG: radical SAM protein [Syntrophobacteraceae bacterium]
MKLPAPKKVLVESEVSETSLVAALRQNLPEAVFEIVQAVSDAEFHSPETLEVVKFRGRFLKSCPGTRHYHCCGYRILHFGTQCTLDCTYCILQAYLNQPNLRLFGNVDEMFLELSGELESNPDRLHRIGTGEFTDSLLLDPFTGLSRTLVPFFARVSNAVLELKTKTTHVDNLLGLHHNGHTITAWSLNAGEIRKHEEPFAATLKERLDAARLCAAEGYFLAFHFDPIIEYPDWRSGYSKTLDRLFHAVDSRRIVWISLGAFRFMPDLKGIIRTRHPHSPIPYGEFIRGLDGKMRYFRDIRVEFYSLMIEKIRKIDPEICVYLCMESDDIWKESFGFSPLERGGLESMLDHAVRARMKAGPGAVSSEVFHS